jgi:hypothetical protein
MPDLRDRPHLISLTASLKINRPKNDKMIIATSHNIQIYYVGIGFNYIAGVVNGPIIEYNNSTLTALSGFMTHLKRGRFHS